MIVRKARINKVFGSGAPVCLNVTLLDGLVAARSAFNSSMNYRSATIFGSARVVEGEPEELRCLKIISDHSFPGRWEELRDPLDSEVKQTGVVAVEIESASAKIAEGPPDDEDFDYETTVSSDVISILREKLGHRTEASDTMGSTQSIHIKDGFNQGYADLRRPNAGVAIQYD